MAVIKTRDISVWARALSFLAAAATVAFGIWSIIFGSQQWGPPSDGAHPDVADAGIAIGSLYIGAGLASLALGLFPRNRVWLGLSILGSVVVFMTAISLLALSFGLGWDVTPLSQPQLPWGITVGGFVACIFMIPVYFHIFSI